MLTKDEQRDMYYEAVDRQKHAGGQRARSRMLQGCIEAEIERLGEFPTDPATYDPPVKHDGIRYIVEDVVPTKLVIVFAEDGDSAIIMHRDEVRIDTINGKFATNKPLRVAPLHLATSYQLEKI